MLQASKPVAVKPEIKEVKKKKRRTKAELLELSAGFDEAPVIQSKPAKYHLKSITDDNIDPLTMRAFLMEPPDAPAIALRPSRKDISFRTVDYMSELDIRAQFAADVKPEVAAQVSTKTKENILFKAGIIDSFDVREARDAHKEVASLLREMGAEDPSRLTEEQKESFWKRLSASTRYYFDATLNCKVVNGARKTFNYAMDTKVGQVVKFVGIQATMAYLTSWFASPITAQLVGNVTVTIIRAVPKIIEDPKSGMKEVGVEILGIGTQHLSQLAGVAIAGDGYMGTVTGAIIGVITKSGWFKGIFIGKIGAKETDVPENKTARLPEPPSGLSDAEKLKWYNVNRTTIIGAAMVAGAAAVLTTAMMAGKNSEALSGIMSVSEDAIMSFATGWEDSPWLAYAGTVWNTARQSSFLKGLVKGAISTQITMRAGQLTSYLREKYDTLLRVSGIDQRTQSWIPQRVINKINSVWIRDALYSVNTANLAKAMGAVLQLSANLAASRGAYKTASGIVDTAAEWESLEDVQRTIEDVQAVAESQAQLALDGASNLGRKLDIFGLFHDINVASGSNLVTVGPPETRETRLDEDKAERARRRDQFRAHRAELEKARLEDLRAQQEVQESNRAVRAQLKAAHRAAVEAERAARLADEQAQRDTQTSNKATRDAIKAAHKAQVDAERAAKAADEKAQRDTQAENKEIRDAIKAAHKAQIDAAKAASLADELNQKATQEANKVARDAQKAAFKAQREAERAARILDEQTQRDTQAANKATRDAIKAAHKAQMEAERAAQAADEKAQQDTQQANRLAREAQRVAFKAQAEAERAQRIADENAQKDTQEANRKAREALKDAHKAQVEADRARKLAEDKLQQDTQEANKLTREALKAAHKAEMEAQRAARLAEEQAQAQRRAEAARQKWLAERAERADIRATERAKRPTEIDDVKVQEQVKASAAWMTKEMTAAVSAFKETNAGKAVDKLENIFGPRIKALGYQGAKVFTSGGGGVLGTAYDAVTGLQAGSNYIGLAQLGIDTADGMSDSEFLATLNSQSSQIGDEMRNQIGTLLAAIDKAETDVMGFNIGESIMAAVGMHPFMNKAEGIANIVAGDKATSLFKDFGSWLQR